MIDGNIPTYMPKPEIMLSFSTNSLDWYYIENVGSVKSSEVSFIEFREKLFAIGGSLPEDILKGSI